MTEAIVAFLIWLIGIIFWAICCAFPVKWLWNWLMPEIFGLTQITVWQAWGLGMLCQCLLSINGGIKISDSKKKDKAEEKRE